ncbi:lipocalin family protein [Pontibacter sp. KCTC 32443]|uniref:lipocalin family protein n=1 Tax=Pontibacter TaxID=323449 RepID=UPI00164EB785|nr:MULTISPECIES: lipocalin family protein [Pontibacter]MBC5774190.1 lipocalin family protein [Pontibacter sp. KCTC 32443]
MKSTRLNTNVLLSFMKTALTLLLAVVLVSCGGDKAGTESMLSGTSSKTWKAKKETNAEGDKEKLTDAEKEQNLQFYADGRFAMGGASTLQTGTWNYDQAAKKLTLQFEDQNVSENFDVLKLSDDELRLRAGDGSEMVMEAEK